MGGEAMTQDTNRVVRGLAWFAIAGQLVFVVAWIVAGANDPGYSHLDDGVSLLGARDAEHAWIVNTAFVVLGLSIAALAPALLMVLPRRRASQVAAALFVVSGAAVAAVGLLPIDCDLATTRCEDLYEAGRLRWQTDAHLWTGVVFDAAFVATTFALARALWPGPAAAGSLGAGLFGIAAAAAAFALIDGDGGGDGLMQRIGLLTVHAWVVIVAAGLLHRTAAGRPSELIPIGPREFLGRAWAGPGGFCLGPVYVDGLARRLTFERESRWLDDEHWIVTDTTRFSNGYTVERRMHAELVGADRVRVVADDMPGGAELVLEDRGYRVVPRRYPLAFPLGPMRFTLRCRDDVRACEGGELLWTIRFSWLGLPVGIIRGRIRATEVGPA
jgi:hypothetical protein